MNNDPQPARLARPIWAVIGAVATTARVLIDVWRLLHDS
jgi:hypothetical protein